tara:strand:+ start:2741 stop:3040 length:300 start_codon:yes stop_codon:yes gene_type:complete
MSLDALNIDPNAIAWEAVGDDNPDSRLLATVQIGPCPFHLEAWQIQPPQPPHMLQIPAADHIDDMHLDAAAEAFGADGPFQTLPIDGKEYLVFMSPFCT